ncbi:hypothetical protein C8J27_102117 [Rhodobacter aestuarii]|uniref:Uncharacterized protein n=1 Tax=Rhodobacter aestuarii TaxID=453582 RepID=A0A1N7N9J5_9RHOB|nr:hypothetical protein [Rhodobacter aestuarii]PTV96323.1 hypothetical protein C8J27_102117 [Rhodobacter aestuarii]SIS95043.1 hypothetical protein SAMN05421580_107117 [Rhodobacter aestuarii]
MAPQLRRAGLALLTGLAGAVMAATTVWANLVWGGGAGFMGSASDLTPTLVVTPALLALHVALAAPLLVFLLAILAAFSGPWPFRLLSVLMFAAGWYWLGETVTARLADDFGMALLPGEAFETLFWHAPLTPALWAGATAAYLFTLSRLMRFAQVAAIARNRDLRQGARAQKARN